MKVHPDGSMTILLDALSRFGRGDAGRGRKELRLLMAAEPEGATMSGPTERPTSVRMATEADEQACLALLRLDLAANAAHIAPVDEEKVLATIQTGTRRRGGCVGVIDDKDGKPVAIIILTPCQWWWSNGWYYMETVNFVHPDHRKSRHVDDLLDFSKWASDQMTKTMGTRVWLLCGVLGGWRVQAKIALYRRKFWQAGAAFVYPAPPLKGN